MGGAAAPIDVGDGTAEVEALLREFPALVRTEDGRVKCSLTGHVMKCKPEVLRPYVKGKRFTQASAKAQAMDALKQFEPHIVRSKFVPDKLFCRITGRYVAANERAVVQHSGGRRFERGVEALSRKKSETGAKSVLLTERDPKEKDEERRAEETRRVREAEAKARSARAENAKAAAAKRSAEAPGEDPKEAAERERLRVNGGFSKELGCWVPPAHILETDSEDEDEDEDVSEDDSGGESESECEPESESKSETESESESESDLETDVVPTVQAPNFAKISTRIKSSANRSGGVLNASTKSSGEDHAGSSAVATKRAARSGLEKGKKTRAKPGKRAKT